MRVSQEQVGMVYEGREERRGGGRETRMVGRQLGVRLLYTSTGRRRTVLACGLVAIRFDLECHVEQKPLSPPSPSPSEESTPRWLEWCDVRADATWR